MVSKKLQRIAVWLDENIERYLLIVTYFYITFIIVVGVFNRFVLQSTSGWEQETARLLFIWLTWIGASLAVRKRLHIRIDFIYQYVSDRSENLLYIFSNLVVITFCVLAFDGFIPVLETTRGFGASLVTLDLSTIYFKAAIPAGLALMTLRAIQMTIIDIQNLWAGEEAYKGERLFEVYEEGDT